jgi:EmrB/QacA subfamily drug resistance transporter
VAACAHRKTWVLVAAVLGSTMAFIDESVVNVALPRIEANLNATLSAMQWVINAYTLCMSALLLIGGSSADQFGRRRIFLIGVTLFALASIACGLAPDVQVLVGARVTQGTGAALLVPCSLALIAASFEERQRGAAIGVWSAASAIAAGAAPLLGGWLVDHVSWRAIFLINPLIAIPTLWITFAIVPESRNKDASPVLDWRGALLTFAGLACVVHALISASQVGWKAWTVLATLGAGFVLLTGFVMIERVTPSPMMPLELFRSRTFSGINLLTLLLYGALGGAFFFLPFLLIQAHGYSATAAGAVYLPFTLVIGALSRWSGGLLDRFGPRGPLLIGAMLTALAFASLTVTDHSYWLTLLSMALLGFAMAIAITPLTATVLNAVPANRTGVASGINNAVASVGSLLVVAILGSVALSVFNRSLDHRLRTLQPSEEVIHSVNTARRGFIMASPPEHHAGAERTLAERIVASSLTETAHVAFWISAALAFVSALLAGATLPRRRQL